MSWFAEWFDSPYYHILYQNRNEEEARLFIDALVAKLEIPKGAKVMDLACGKGRHSKQLNVLGLDVTGLDLSAESIGEAKLMENETLHFDVHDMREVYKEGRQDYILNLFTSFGYFEKKKDTAETIDAIHANLKQDGFLIIDFFNAVKVERDLVGEEVKRVEDIDFHIKRTAILGHILKEIRFEDDDVEYKFEERVQSLRLEDFKMFFQGRFEIVRLFGSYQLDDFDKDESDRLIVVAQKI